MGHDISLIESMTGTTKPDMVGHSCNPSMWETEAGPINMSVRPARDTQQACVSKTKQTETTVFYIYSFYQLKSNILHIDKE